MTRGGNKTSRVANFWNDLIERVRKTDKPFRHLPAKNLRKTAGNLIRSIAGGEVQGIFLAHGQVVATDHLSEVYSNRPFAKLFTAIDEMHDRLQPLWDALRKPF